MSEASGGGGAVTDPGTVACVRCGREAAALPRPPLPGPAGEEVRRKVCPACWAEWQHAEVMVINELRLDFMQPRSLEVLERHMREFLLLDPAAAQAEAEAADPADGSGESGGGPEAPRP